MLPINTSKHLTAASANCICTSQSLAATGNLVLNGGSVTTKPLGPFGADITLAVLDTARRIAIVSGGDDHLLTAHIYGMRQGGQPINEVLALTNAGTATSVLDYLNVSTIAVSGSVATTAVVGSSATGSTDWAMPNYDLTPFNMIINTQLSGSVTYNIETTTGDYLAPAKSSYDTTPQPIVNTVSSGATAAASATLSTPVTGVRYTVTAGTGTLSAQALQSGIVNY